MSILELCTSLSTAQVLKIIKSYTLDDCENAIKPVFIEMLTVELNKRTSNVRCSAIDTESDTNFFFLQFDTDPKRCVYNGRGLCASTKSRLQIRRNEIGRN